MSTSGKFTPITAISSPISTKFGKSSQTAAKSTHDQVLAIKFSPMHQNGIDPEWKVVKSVPHFTSPAHRPPHTNGYMSSHARAEIAHKKNSSLCKSSLVKLIGSFLVGIVCLSIVVAAVMIRTDSARDQTSRQAATTSSINRRSAPHPSATSPNASTTSPIPTSESLHRATLQMLNSDISVGLVSSDSVNVPVPIKVVIDPQLIAPRATSQTGQPDGEPTSVHLKQSLDTQESGTRQLRAGRETEKSPPVDLFNRYVIEMDIKVKKSN